MSGLVVVMLPLCHATLPHDGGWRFATPPAKHKTSESMQSSEIHRQSV